jgi:hypothetical protein
VRVPHCGVIAIRLSWHVVAPFTFIVARLLAPSRALQSLLFSSFAHTVVAPAAAARHTGLNCKPAETMLPFSQAVSAVLHSIHRFNLISL